MTNKEALQKTKEILFALMHDNTKYVHSVFSASSKEDIDWLCEQLDQLIAICNELKINLKNE